MKPVTFTSRLPTRFNKSFRVCLLNPAGAKTSYARVPHGCQRKLSTKRPIFQVCNSVEIEGLREHLKDGPAPYLKLNGGPPIVHPTVLLKLDRPIRQLQMIESPGPQAATPSTVYAASPSCSSVILHSLPLR